MLPDIDSIRRYIGRITYKPGSTLRHFIRSPKNDGVYVLELELHTEVVNVDKYTPSLLNPRGTIGLFTNRQHPFVFPLDEYQLREWVKSLVSWWELHEMHEWLRIDGNHIENPHQVT